MDHYTRPAEEVLKALETDLGNGLTLEQVSKRKEQYGENALAAKPPKSLLQRFLAQFADVLIIILLLSAAVSFVITLMNPEEGSFFEPILILVIVIILLFSCIVPNIFPKINRMF